MNNNGKIKYYKITLKQSKENDKKQIINKFGFRSLSKKNINTFQNEPHRKTSNSMIINKPNKSINKNNFSQSPNLSLADNNKKRIPNSKFHKNSQSCSFLLPNNQKNKKSRNYLANSTGNLNSIILNQKFTYSYSQQKKSHELNSTNEHTQSNGNIFHEPQKINQKIKQVTSQQTDNNLISEKQILFNRLFTNNKNKNSSNSFKQKNIFNSLYLHPRPIIKKEDDNNKSIFNKLCNKSINQQNNFHNKKITPNKINNNSNIFINLNKNNKKHNSKHSINNNLQNSQNIAHDSALDDIKNNLPPNKKSSSLIITNEKSSETIKENCLNINKIIDNTKKKHIENFQRKGRKKICRIIIYNNKKINNNILNHSFKTENLNCNEYSLINNNILHEPCRKKILSNENSSFTNYLNLCEKGENGFDDDTDELEDVQDEEIIHHKRFVASPVKKRRKELYNFFSRGYSYNLSSTVIRSNVKIKKTFNEKNFAFIEEINNRNNNIQLLDLKKFMNLKSICIYKIICFAPELYSTLINIRKYIKKKIIHSFDVLFTPIINNFQKRYMFLQLINYQIVVSNIIYHNKKFFILNLLILSKIKTKQIGLSFEMSCNYLSNNKILDYLWKIDIHEKKDISLWINTELNSCKNNIRNFSFTSQVSSFTYGDEIKLFLNINNLNPSTIEWFKPVFSAIKPGVYEKSKLISKFKFDPLRACEIESQVLLWHNFEDDKNDLLIKDFKEIFKEFFFIKDIFYDVSRYPFYKIILIAKKTGLILKNKYCSFDIKIVDSGSSIQNEIQCIYFMNSNFYCNKMEIRVNTKVCFYIIDIK